MELNKSREFLKNNQNLIVLGFLVLLLMSILAIIIGNKISQRLSLFPIGLDNEQPSSRCQLTVQVSSLTPVLTPFLRACSEIGRGYDMAFCSQDTSITPAYSCGQADDPVRNKLCYYDIRVASASDCLAGQFCRYYRRSQCGASHEECQSRCSQYGCRQ